MLCRKLNCPYPHGGGDRGGPNFQSRCPHTLTKSHSPQWRKLKNRLATHPRIIASMLLAHAFNLTIRAALLLSSLMFHWLESLHMAIRLVMRKFQRQMQG